MADSHPSIVSFFLEHAAKRPEKRCLVIGQDQVTYGQLRQRVAQLKEHFERNGVRRNDNVLATICPSIDFYASLLAIFAIGAVVVVLDTSMGLKRANHCIRLAKPVAWVHRKGEYWYFKFISAAVRGIPIDILIDHAPAVDQDSVVHVTTNERALATFTTGSTGLPKILYRTHAFLVLQTKSVSHSYMKVCGIKAEESSLGCDEEVEEVAFTNMPILGLHALRVGSSVLFHFNIKNFDPAAVVDQMADTGVTYGALSPAFAHRLCQYCSGQNQLLPIKFMVVGGSPLYYHMVEDMAKAMVGQRLIIGYGSTEAEPIAVVDAKSKLAKEVDSKLGGHLVGSPLIKGGVKIIQVTEDGSSSRLEDVEVSVDEIGEIAIAGWHVNIEGAAESRILKDSTGKQWLKMGDAGYLDKEGNVWLVGRISWRVQRNGKTYWSIVVEEKILKFLRGQVTYVIYLFQSGQAHLFLEAPNGLSSSQEERLRRFLETEDVPVDCLRVYKTVPRDRRHNSKPDMAKLFPDKKPAVYRTLLAVVLGILAIWWLWKHGSFQVAVSMLMVTVLVAVWMLRTLDVL